MKKLILFLSGFLLVISFAVGQVIFDPANVAGLTLPAGSEVVVIDGTSYLKVPLNGWSTSFTVPAVVVQAGSTEFTCEIKYEAVTSADMAKTRSTVQLMPASWTPEFKGEFNPSPASFKKGTIHVDAGTSISIIQLYSQSTVTWSEITGDIIYLGKIEAPVVVVPADGNIIKGSNMEDSTAWTAVWRTDAADRGSAIEFNYKGDVPSAGEGGALRIAGYGQAGAYVFQEVTLKPGHKYSFDAAFKNISTDSITSTWVEVILSRRMPKASADFAAASNDFIYSLNTWNGADTLNYDGLLSDRFGFGKLDPHSFLVSDTVTQTKWYAIIKVGCWNLVGVTKPAFNFLFDNITLKDLGADPWAKFPVEKVVFGTVDSPADFTGTASLRYDADSIYMIFNAVDDSIVTKGNAYQVDNIEIYFDMDNSKNIHWPRNGGWLKSIDDAYDLNDYQLRLVPGVAFATNNTARPSSASIASGYNQVYTRTANGYEFKLNIAWKSLMSDFVATSGKLIGFDILWSDNDKVASDANRNQITWNSPTGNTFNDPSLFGVLQLTPLGSFISVLDTEKPTAPSNLATVVTDKSVLLTWDPSTDNRVVQSYIISDKATAVDTILALKTGNKFTFKNLADGTHKFGVTAVDVYGNKSAKTSTDNVKVSVSEFSNSTIKLYPNPTTGIVNILTNNSKPTKLSVYNVAGELVRSVEFIQSHTLDMSANTKGVYFIHLTANGNTQISKLVVK